MKNLITKIFSKDAVIFRMTAFFTLIFFVSGCFTGIESTPKITSRDVKKQNVREYESNVLSNVISPKPADWVIGKEFYVTDSRVARALKNIEPESADLENKILKIASIETSPSLIGENLVEIIFEGPEGIHATFPTNLTREKWEDLTIYSLPYMIDLDLVNQAKNLLLGRTFYYKEIRRLDSDGKEIEGLRYVPVKIVEVLPGDATRQLRIFFKGSEDRLESVLVSIGSEKTSLRNFDSRFATSDPRKKYPAITDEVWELIQHGKVRTGMTPDECRLALGAPDNYRKIPTTAGMVEYWSYINGAFLTFEDGLLSRFRL